MAKTLMKARLHEHSGRIAIHLEDAPTVYLAPELAGELAEVLALAAKQIRNGYHFPTTEIDATPYKPEPLKWEAEYDYYAEQCDKANRLAAPYAVWLRMTGRE